MCDGCDFQKHPSQIYHIRSSSNPNGCIIPSNWKEEKEEEEEEEGDEEEGKKKAENKKVEKDISPLLFGNLSKTYAELWKNFKEPNTVEYNVAKPLPLDDTRLRECGCCGELPLTCGRRGNRKYYEHQYD